MALKDITTSIIKEAEKQAETIIQAGKKEVQQINKEYQNLAAEKKEQYIKRQAHERSRQVDQALFAQKIKAKNELLEEKKKLIDQVFYEALKKLQRLPKKYGLKILIRLLTRLPKVAQGEIIPAKGATDLMTKALIKSKLRYKISSDTIAAKGGFRFTSPQVDVDNTYENLLDKSRSALESKIAQILFEKESVN